ncbi:MAG TPA: UDP-N-acetylmuramoyl-L-alanyl-D-glutamate--2,6-diaminopimelate ligase [Rhizomicrobium sp.]|jgi:UDP-N-acetylmuramoyl-L-alanyl-D-glutamate--2,6-diaminopimelate ligase|nr:UDP-N-acetylmuramoyl-L-alanyl-D-glutamate--2,6-diaminopimelate ligase [Rhizomicrobium sp.]
MAPELESTLDAAKVGRNAMKASREFAGLAADSREVGPGYLFAALPGVRADGADFVEDAVRRGASAVLGRPELGAKVRALGVRFIAEDNPRLALARRASAFFAAQPETVAAVTGTNGKTSVSVFLRQIWRAAGHEAASLGTIGVVTAREERSLRQTTPDPIELHRLLADLQSEGVERLAIEASSHGLDQYRLDGVDIAAAAFTNITRDHLDYHPTFEHYLASKLRLFREVVRSGGAAAINADAAYAERFLAAARERGLRTLTVGTKGDGLKLLDCAARAECQTLSVAFEGRAWRIALPLAGAFQASNALVAAALAIALGDDPGTVFAGLERLGGAPGRLERVARSAAGAPIYVDYAHTPDALETVLSALRPHALGRLHLVFGCGGDRDKGKRPLMGAVAAKFADRIVVTDDNPRSEDASLIRREILTCCPGAREIPDRAEAIAAAIGALGSGDALVIAGKGHESGQIVMDEVRPFSDRAVAIEAAVALGGARA